MDFTGPGVWEGLAEFHIIRDDEEDALGLPSGPRELPLMIVDRSFDLDGSLLYPAIDPTGLVDAGVTVGFEAGVLGDVTLVNGVPWPVVNVDGAATGSGSSTPPTPGATTYASTHRRPMGSSKSAPTAACSPNRCLATTLKWPPPNAST